MKYKTPKFHFLITIILMIANILSGLWTPIRNGRVPTHPKFGSDVEADDTTNTPIGYSKIYYSWKRALWGEQDRL